MQKRSQTLRIRFRVKTDRSSWSRHWNRAAPASCATTVRRQMRCNRNTRSKSFRKSKNWKTRTGNWRLTIKVALTWLDLATRQLNLCNRSSSFGFRLLLSVSRCSAFSNVDSKSTGERLVIHPPTQYTLCPHREFACTRLRWCDGCGAHRARPPLYIE